MTALDDLPIVADIPVATAAQMAEADRVAIEELGIPAEVLMESAAHQVARVARLLLGTVVARRVVALAGRGNNGGDALAAARRLSGWGADARAVLAHERDRMRPLARTQADLAQRCGVHVAPFAPDGEDTLGHADLLLDGLLGYSGSGAPREDLAELIRLANRSRVPILAIDLPSGLHPDTGQPQGVAIRAACTLTLGLPKPGLVAPAARALVGELVLADIGIPPGAYARPEVESAGLFGRGDLLRVVAEGGR